VSSLEGTVTILIIVGDMEGKCCHSMMYLNENDTNALSNLVIHGVFFALPVPSIA